MTQPINQPPSDDPHPGKDVWVGSGANAADLPPSGDTDPGPAGQADPRLERAGWMSARWWSVCSACTDRIEPGETQALADIPDAGRRWVHGDCADDLADPSAASARRELRRAVAAATDTLTAAPEASAPRQPTQAAPAPADPGATTSHGNTVLVLSSPDWAAATSVRAELVAAWRDLATAAGRPTLLHEHTAQGAEAIAVRFWRRWGGPTETIPGADEIGVGRTGRCLIFSRGPDRRVDQAAEAARRSGMECRSTPAHARPIIPPPRVPNEHQRTTLMR